MKILVAAGASGGHIFPALAFLEKLEEKKDKRKILLILPEKEIVKQLSGVSYEIKRIAMPGFRPALNYKNLKNLIKLIKSALLSSYLVLKFNPDIVVSFGGLASIPVVLLAWLLRAKTLIHEQNVIPGQANKFLAWFADKIAISFTETSSYLEKYRDKISLTGNPLRKSLVLIEKAKALDFFGFDKNKFTVLVMGGSQGSHKINSEFLRAVGLLGDKSGLQVIHLSGIADYDLLKSGYAKLGIKFGLFNFFDTMQYAYSAADLAVCRAGAMTISELIFYKLPGIIIPYPYARGHQEENARVLSNKNCAVVIKDEFFEAERLKSDLENFLSEINKIENLRLGYRDFIRRDSAELLAEEALSFN